MPHKSEINKENTGDVFKYPQKYAIHPFKIAGNLYYVGNTSVSSHLIDTGEGLILIDTTYPQTYPLLVNSIWELGFSVYDIKYILHSHGHFDHFGGTSGLVALTKAKTFLGAEDVRMFRERPELALIDHCPFSYLELFTPDVEMEDGGIISLGNTEIKTVWTPGHTPGVVSFLIKVTDGAATYTAGMHGGTGFNTLNMKFIESFNLDAGEVRKSFLYGLDKLENEKVDITLGNHPGQSQTVEKREKMIQNPGAQNPFIDSGEWKRFLGDIKTRFDKMLAEESGV